MVKNYKINYTLLGGSKSKNYDYILLDGTSASGKSTICDYLKSKGYNCLKGDNLLWSDEYSEYYGKEYNKLPNEFVTPEFKKNMENFITGDYLYQKAVEKSKSVIDWVIPDGIINSFNKNNKPLYIILVYASLSTLARNMISRKAKNDPRGTFVFEQYSKRFTKTSKDKAIDTVNRKAFKKLLLDNFKMEFTGEKELDDFCNEIFKNMEIDDDEDHGVNVKEEDKPDYLLNTNDKTKKDIENELNFLF